MDGKTRGGDKGFSQKGVMSEAIPPPFGCTPCMMQQPTNTKSPRQSLLDSPSKVRLRKFGGEKLEQKPN